MIVYMIMDDQTGQWYNFDREWYIEQENGTVWANEVECDGIFRAISEPNNAVKMRFVLAPVIEGADWPDVIVLDAETWVFSPDAGTWFCGTEKNGCGVYEQGCVWHANVVIEGNTSMLEPHSNREEAMVAATTYWRKNK